MLAVASAHIDRIHDANASEVTARVAWGDVELVASIWSIGSNKLELITPFGSPLPPKGTTVTISCSKNIQHIGSTAKVSSVSEKYGAYRLLTLKSVATDQMNPIPQRRANQRFRLSHLFPLFCFTRDPLDGRILALRATDISNGGVSLVCESKGLELLPGSRIKCSFHAPGVGRFIAELLVRHTLRCDDRFRVAAEFLRLPRGARSVIRSCLTRPASNNSIKVLLREKLLSDEWDSLIEFSRRLLPRTESSNPTMEISAHLCDELVCSVHIDVENQAIDSMRIPVEELSRRLILMSLNRFLIADESTRQFGVNACDVIESIEGLSSREMELDVESSASGQNRHAAKKEFVEWNEYAEAYDIMCKANPAYEENLSLFRRWSHELSLPADPTICDVGAGTGNYLVEIAKLYPKAKLIHIDSDPMMNRTARQKYKSDGLSNVTFQTCAAVEAEVAPNSIDALICVNALYTFADPAGALSRFHSWLKPGGELFLIDLGRPMNVANWTKYIVGSNLRRQGVKQTVSAFLRGRKAIGQNRRIRQEQESGAYWLHTPHRFATALKQAGFTLRILQTCYRDVCDLAICSK